MAMVYVRTPEVPAAESKSNKLKYSKLNLNTSTVFHFDSKLWYKNRLTCGFFESENSRFIGRQSIRKVTNYAIRYIPSGVDELPVTKIF